MNNNKDAAAALVVQNNKQDNVDNFDQDDILDNKWNRIKHRLKAELGEEVFSSWFGRIEVEDLTGGTLTLSVPTKFLKSWIVSHYCEKLFEHWQNADKSVLRIDIRVRSHETAIARNARQAKINNKNFENPALELSTSTSVAGSDLGSTIDSKNNLSSPIDPRFVYDSFAVGDSNRLTYEASRRMVTTCNQMPNEFNMLYLHGGVGLGKTHLLQAMTWEARQANPNRRVLYLTAEWFMYRFAAALKSQDIIDFKDQLRDIDLLLIDDMQFLRGPSSQREFCHTLNALIEGGRYVVVAADRPPQELDNLDERMRSRLSAGLVTDVKNHEKSVRMQILRNRLINAQKRFGDLKMGEDVLEYVASQIVGNGRDLEGAFTRIVANNQLTKAEITVEMAERSIQDLIRQPEPRRVRIEHIQKIVARHFNVSRQEIISSRRTRAVVKPRQISMYLAKTMTDRSFPDIGRRFGGRDHTTVLHAVRKIEALLKEDTRLADEVTQLRRMIEE